MSNPYPERPAQDPNFLPDYDMWAGESAEPYYGGYGDPYEQYGDPYAQQQQYPVAPSATPGHPEAAAYPADVPPAPDFEPTPAPQQGSTPEEEAQNREDWTDLLGLAHFASEQAAGAYTDRRKKAKGLNASEEYDEEGHVVDRAPEHKELLKVTPDILLVQPTRFRLFSAENLKTAWQQRRYGRIGRMLLPHWVEEVPVMAAWTVARTEVDAAPQTSADTEATAVLSAAQRYAQKHRKVTDGEAVEPTPVEGSKEIERIAVTSKGELIRLIGSDDALKEPGKPLRIVIRNEIPTLADDAGDDEKTRVEKLKADEEIVTGYVKDNADAFTSTMGFEEEMDAGSRPRATREQIREGLAALLAKAGVTIATD